jgi:hypothetical protein
MAANRQVVAAEIERLRSIFAPHTQGLVQQWLPQGRREGQEWVALNPTLPDGSPGSFKINLRTGEWSDFATGNKGGDVISFRAYLNGNLGVAGAQVAAAKEIAKTLGVVTAFDEEERKKQERKAKDAKLSWKEVKVWEYQNADGDAVFEVVRLEATTDDGKRKKRFVQRHRDPDGKSVNSVDGVERVPFRLPELLEDIAQERVIFFVEGEKCADAARDKIGVPATTNPMGAGKWWPELTQYFRGADVVVIPDGDAPRLTPKGGRGPRCQRVRILDPAPSRPRRERGRDWAQAGGAAPVLYDLVERHAVLWDTRPIVSAFGAIPWWDMDRPGEEHLWLIKGVLTLGERSMLAGPSQSGKSFLALDMALACCGTPWGGPRAAASVSGRRRRQGPQEARPCLSHAPRHRAGRAAALRPTSWLA